MNANSEYLCRIESAVLFGSMLTETERLGDVDLAVEFSQKSAGEKAFGEWCDRRRHAAQETGRRFRSTFDWVVWPKKEIFQLLRERSRTLSIHEWECGALGLRFVASVSPQKPKSREVNLGSSLNV